MGFSDWLIIGGAALLIHNGLKKESATYENFTGDIKPSELNRSRLVNEKRKSMPCYFNDGLSENEFIKIANYAKKKIRRVRDIQIKGAVLFCNVVSQTGYSDWNFSVDFNDWGHITGTYWMQTDNDDSSIPHHFGQMVSGMIHDFYREYGIALRDLSDYVDNNKDLETPNGLNYTNREKGLKKLFGEKNNISITYGNRDLIGEHLYPVISMLRDTGFKNIKTFSMKDINDRSGGYYYQVEKVVIAGSNYLEYGMCFPENTEVIITYHEKQVIQMPFSELQLRHKNYIDVGHQLQKLGFTQIYERKIEDLLTGWVIKDGSVESILLDGLDKTPIQKNSFYDYDQEIVICYHTKKS